MPMMNMAGVLEAIRKHGPARVVINHHGEAASYRAAMTVHHMLPLTIFVRGDGWTLGAPAGLEMVAYNTWAGDWVGVLIREDTSVPFTREVTVSEWLEGRGDV